MDKRRAALGMALAGLIAAGAAMNASVAQANEHDQESAEKHGCNAKEKGKAKKKKQEGATAADAEVEAEADGDKNACAGKNGCDSKE